MGIKKFLFVVSFLFLASYSHAAIVSNFTGDVALFSKINVSSTSASSLVSYSTSRLEFTCINADSSNTVYIGTSTTITAGASNSFPLFSKQVITLDNHTSLAAIADIGVASVNIYCITENP